MYNLDEKTIKGVVNKGARLLLEYCQKNDIHYLVTGVSGGLDSAVALGFAEKACLLGQKNNYSLTSVGAILPCASSSNSVTLGRKAIEKFNAQKIEVDLSRIFGNYMDKVIFGEGESLLNQQLVEILGQTKKSETILADWDWSMRIAQGNIKARLRMITLYHIARMLSGMVMSTDNLSEFWMGFWTICGDVGDFGVIQNILKGLELYEIAKYLAVPQEIIDAKPDDGLGVANGDEDQLGATYEVLDQVMIHLTTKGFYIDGDLSQLTKLPKIAGVSEETVKKLALRCLRGAYKRRGTIVLTRDELGLPPLPEVYEKLKS